MYSRIVVPLDGSRFAESSLPLAGMVQRGSGAALELVSSHDPVPPPVAGSEELAGMAVPVHVDTLGAVPVTAGEMRQSLREERTTYLHEAAKRLREASGVEAEVALLEGRADQAIIERVQATGADLVVMATHGRGAMERAWLGSVADRVVREATVPVLLVRPVEEAAPDLTSTTAVTRILVPLDGSSLSEAVLGPAADLAAALDVPLTLLRVVGSRMDLGSTYLPHAAKEQREQVAREREEAESYLEGVRTRLAGEGVELAGADIVEGPAAHSILERADPDGAEIIAMATHGRGGLRRLVLGSVTDKVVRAALGPVLAVRPGPDEER
jgi:nucleotide-binding universal stress UspA family protein